MKLTLFYLTLLTAAISVQSRFLIGNDNNRLPDTWSPVLNPADNQIQVKIGPVDPDRTDKNVAMVFQDDPTARTASDLVPYVTTAIVNGVVRKVLIKPLLKGAKKMIPKRITGFYSVVSEKYMSKGVFKVISPLSPILSSYAYNKFEQGIFWGLKKGGSYIVDNFIEFV